MSFASPPPPVIHRCPKCRQPMRLADKIWNMQATGYIRIFKCRCGELVWDD